MSKFTGDERKTEQESRSYDDSNPFEVLETFSSTADATQEVTRRISPFHLRQGEKTTLIGLDYIDRKRVGLLLHKFFDRGHRLVRCIASSLPDGLECPYCVALARKKKAEPRSFTKPNPTWFWLTTWIDTTEWTPLDSDTTYSHFRKLVLIPSSKVDDFDGLEEMAEGFRGQMFAVSRGRDRKSPAIGSQWFPKKKLDEKQLLAELAPAAEARKIPVEEYAAPASYLDLFPVDDYDDAVEKAMHIADVSDLRRSKAAAPATVEDDEIPF